MYAASAVSTDWLSAAQAASSAGFCSGTVTGDDVDVELALVAGIDDELQAGTKARRAMAPISSAAVAMEWVPCDEVRCSSTTAPPPPAPRTSWHLLQNGS
jgi:hypothetical protein